MYTFMFLGLSVIRKLLLKASHVDRVGIYQKLLVYHVTGMFCSLQEGGEGGPVSETRK
jgi:hypothetical protein